MHSEKKMCGQCIGVKAVVATAMVFLVAKLTEQQEI